jgi:hypothetical protein
MPRPRAQLADAEVAVRAIEPTLLKGGDTVKTLSAEFFGTARQVVELGGLPGCRTVPR